MLCGKCLCGFFAVVNLTTGFFCFKVGGLSAGVVDLPCRYLPAAAAERKTGGWPQLSARNCFSNTVARLGLLFRAMIVKPAFFIEIPLSVYDR